MFSVAGLIFRSRAANEEWHARFWCFRRCCRWHEAAEYRQEGIGGTLYLFFRHRFGSDRSRCSVSNFCFCRLIHCIEEHGSHQLSVSASLFAGDGVALTLNSFASQELVACC